MVQAFQTGLFLPLEADASIGAVLHNKDPMGRGKFDHRLAALARHGDSGRVVEIRYVVDELRKGTPLSLESRQNGAQLLDVEPFGVLCDFHELGAMAAKDWNAREVSGSGHHHRVALVEE